MVLWAEEPPLDFRQQQILIFAGPQRRTKLQRRRLPMTEKVRPGTIRPFTREDVLNALARAGAKAVARAQALGLEPVIRSQEEADRDREAYLRSKQHPT